jgi:hypothetical protein
MLVAIAIAFNLWVLRAERLPVAYPNDSAMHFQMTNFAMKLMSHGVSPLDHWYPFLSLGSPFFVDYQSFSAIVIGALSHFFGSQETFAWSLYLLLSLWPICVYVSARLLGRSKAEAAVAAILAPLLFSITGHGFEDKSYTWIGNGLWSQLWAMWTLPLAWGFTWRYVGQRKYFFPAVVALSLTIAFHFLTAYIAGLTLIVWVVLQRRDFLRRLARAALLGGVALMATLWVTLPLLAHAKWLAVNQFQVGTVINNSYGAPQVLSWLARGQIYDSGRFPVLTILVAVGIVLSAIRFRNDERARALIGVWVLSMLLFFGRPTLSVVLNLLPGNQSILFQRYIAEVQLAGLFLAGVAVVAIGEWVLGTAKRLRPVLVTRVSSHRLYPTLRVPVAIILLILVLTPAWSEVSSYDSRSAGWIHYQRAVDASDGVALNAMIELAESRGGGRIYAGMPSNWGRHFLIGDVPVYIYMEQEGVDAVGFTLRTSSTMTDPEAYFNQYNPGDYVAFGVHYLILPSGRQPSIPAKMVISIGPYALWSVASRGLFHVVDTRSTISANASDLGLQTKGFLWSTTIEKNIYPTMSYDGIPAATPTLANFKSPAGAPGEVLSESDDLTMGEAQATVLARRTSVVLFSSSFEPGWSVSVDGRPAQSEMIAPALLGVTVLPGKHTVRFTFHGYSKYSLLYVLGVFTLMGAGLGPILWPRRSSLLKRMRSKSEIAS